MEFNEALIARRAVIFFDPENHVSAETLTKIIRTLTLAPSGLNLRCLSPVWYILRRIA